MERVTLFSILVIVGLLAACGGPAATPTPEPTPTPVEVLADKVEDLVGAWVCSALGASVYVEFLADGTMRMASSVQRLQSAPIATGNVWFEGPVFHETDTLCSCGKGTYEVWVVREGGKTAALRWKAIEDCCAERSDCYRGLTKRPGSR
jgi:hypothetical protein